ncbi:MAG: hypothetical protein FRX49_02756 [Trebouxia sp. A1-2]|nr:MAG: hypothetical protein FRX49_02756 [Trebouxia sp. A1-2]
MDKSLTHTVLQLPLSSRASWTGVTVPFRSAKQTHIAMQVIQQLPCSLVQSRLDAGAAQAIDGVLDGIQTAQDRHGAAGGVYRNCRFSLVGTVTSLRVWCEGSPSWSMECGKAGSVPAAPAVNLRRWGRGDASHGPAYGLNTMADMSNMQPGQKGRKISDGN